jgi:signal transduction histidine kinase
MTSKKTALHLLTEGIAHDFNSALTSVTAHASSLLQDPTLSDEAHERVRIILGASTIGRNLAQELVLSSNAAPLQLPLVNLNFVISDIVPVIEGIAGGDIVVEIVLAPTAPIIRANINQLLRVVLNLTLNARDAMPLGGLLKVTICEGMKGDQGKRVHLLSRTSDRFVVLVVADTGCGIDPAIQRQIFKPFFTTKPGRIGSGLGLYIVKQIVHHHKGHLSMQSTKGQGTTFSIYLPVATPEPNS